jgi:branched-chain amino acid transport system ATP-binding protein
MKVLELIDVGINFAGVKAVRGVTMSIVSGERRAIIGPNGAGKTTLFNLIGGQLHPSSGTIRLLGRDVRALPAHRRTYLGLSRTFQISRLFLDLTVLENMLLGVQGTRLAKLSLFRPAQADRGVRERAEELLAQWQLIDYRDKAVRNLSYGTQRQLEIAMALAPSPRLLLLDEPTAGLSRVERNLVTARLGALDPELSVLLTEHDMDVVFDFARHITVLDHGEIMADGDPQTVQRNPAVHEIYFGTD